MDIKHVTDLLAAAAPGDFLDVAKFNQHSFGACDISGTSPVWEMHPDTDEFFYVISGTMEFTLLRETEAEIVTLPTGAVGVIPRGLWHRPAAPDGAKFIYFTPGQSLHSAAADPRKTAAGETSHNPGNESKQRPQQNTDTT